MRSTSLSPLNASSLSPIIIDSVVTSFFEKRIYEGTLMTLTLEECSLMQSINASDETIGHIVQIASIVKTERDTTESTCYCNGTMRDMATGYRNVHGYVSLFVCIFGTLANSINIAVLTRKEMKTAPFTYILTWLAVTDMIVMVEYIPFALYMYLDSQWRTARFSYSGAIYMLIHTHFSQVLHTMSICLTLTLAFWRRNATRYPEKCKTLWTRQKCVRSVKIAMLFPLIICIPSFFMFDVQWQVAYEKRECQYLYYLDLSDLAKSHNELLYIINLWLYAVVIKLLPCVILVLISVALIQALHNTTRRKEKLQNITDHLNKNIKVRRTKRRADRSSHMLIAILVLFLLTEFPQCILGILSGVLGRCFFRNCYHLFGEIMDILALLNGAINFVLYCTMSKQFRSTFMELCRYLRIINRTSSKDHEFHI